MKISSLPENYAGAFSELIYRVDEAAPQQIVEVEVLGELSTDLLGIKLFRGRREYEVNISNYVRRALDEPAPYFNSMCTGYSAVGRCTTARIAVDGVPSEPRTFLAGSKGAAPGRLLSDAPVDRRLSPGQTDELSFAGIGPEPLVIDGYLTRGGVRERIFSQHMQGEIVSFLINADHVADLARNSTAGYTHLVIETVNGGEFVPVGRYELCPRQANAVRLCWVNPYGALDYHTFARTGVESVRFGKQSIYAAGGYNSYDVHSERLTVVESGYESADTVMWLAGIVGAPRVWICEPDGGFSEVDVLTDSVEASVDAPSAVRLTLRGRKRDEYQSF